MAAGICAGAARGLKGSWFTAKAVLIQKWTMASDPISASSLGDLPNAGYSTQRERELSDAIMLFMREVERERIWLLSIVIDGRDKFRHVILKEYRGLGLADRLADLVFDYFERQAGKYPIQQREALLSMDNRQRFGLM